MDYDIYEAMKGIDPKLYELPVKGMAKFSVSTAITFYLDEGHLYTQPNWIGLARTPAFYLQHTRGQRLFIPDYGLSEAAGREAAMCELQKCIYANVDVTSSVIETWLPADAAHSTRTCELPDPPLNHIFVALRHPDKRVRKLLTPTEPSELEI